MRAEQVDRYARHLVLKEIGGAGQNALLKSRVAIVGAGGLGGPAALYLAAAGVGHIAIIDDDAVDLSNLQRQIQFGTDDIGQSKATVLADRLRTINPDCVAGSRNRRLNENNASRLLQDFDLVLDGTDRFQTRHTINAVCLALRTPLVSGAVGRFDGQVSLFEPPGPCYRCLAPDAPDDEHGCAEIGVIGALTGIIGSAMALEAIKYITKSGESLRGRLWIYDGLRAESRTIRLPKDPACPACSI